MFLLLDRIISQLFLITSVPMLWLMRRLWIWVSGILLVFYTSPSLMVNLFCMIICTFYLSIVCFFLTSSSVVVYFVMFQEPWPLILSHCFKINVVWLSFVENQNIVFLVPVIWSRYYPKQLKTMQFSYLSIWIMSNQTGVNKFYTCLLYHVKLLIVSKV